ncbi:MAG: hypothetical protein RBU37_26550 [Myxococcota bacterium]|jgi:hypothetical protein|nr:hypothetical protein [Myxococcota bacterium]
MPRQFDETTTLADMESSCIFTIAAVTADPAASALAERTQAWLPLLDAERELTRQEHLAEVTLRAQHHLAHWHLDETCNDFGNHLLLALAKDTSNPRWRAHFDQRLSSFVRQPLHAQMLKVKSWLSASSDPVLETFRERLSSTVSAVESSLAKLEERRLITAARHQRRIQLAEKLTAERDALHDELSSIAREKGLDRNWPNAFFYVEPRRTKVKDEPSED